MLFSQRQKALIQWKDKPSRRALLIRGPRRVGKTYEVRRFGERHFRRLLHIDLVEHPHFAPCFKEGDAEEILHRLESLSGMQLIDGQTLLFLDEIQASREALSSLPLLNRARPNLHIIAAGALADLALEELGLEHINDQTDSLFLQPLSFSEFLKATGQERLNDYIQTLRPGMQLPRRGGSLARGLRAYLTVGGMPEAVNAYAQGTAPRELEHCLFGILSALQSDFGTFTSGARSKYLQEVFSAAPRLVGSTCKYSNINQRMQSRDLKRAVIQLWRSGCLHPVYHTSSSRATNLESGANRKKFQLLFPDAGLRQRALRQRTSLIFAERFLDLDDGRVARQFVGQQLLANLPANAEPRLYFWAREARNSQARVDFLAKYDDTALPVVVREGKRGTLKSLDLYFKHYPETPLALRFCENELSFEDKVLSMPLYMAPYWKDVAKAVL